MVYLGLIGLWYILVPAVVIGGVCTLATGSFPLGLVVVLVIDLFWSIVCKFDSESSSDFEAISAQDFLIIFGNLVTPMS